MNPGVVDLTPSSSDPNRFDSIMRVVEFVVEQSESLALDSAKDRATLIARLQVALGAVPTKAQLADKVTRSLWERWLKTQPADYRRQLRRGIR